MSVIIESGMTIDSGVNINVIPSGNNDTIHIADSGVTPGSYSSPIIIVNNQGTIISAIDGPQIDTITAGTGLTASTAANETTVSVTDCMAAGKYPPSQSVTVNAQGQIIRITPPCLFFDDFFYGPIAALSTNGVLMGGDTPWWQSFGFVPANGNTAYTQAVSTVTSNEIGVVSMNINKVSLLSNPTIFLRKMSATVQFYDNSTTTLEFRVMFTGDTGAVFSEMLFQGGFANTRIQKSGSVLSLITPGGTTVIGAVTLLINTWYKFTMVMTTPSSGQVLYSLYVNGVLQTQQGPSAVGSADRLSFFIFRSGNVELGLSSTLFDYVFLTQIQSNPR